MQVKQHSESIKYLLDKFMQSLTLEYLQANEKYNQHMEKYGVENERNPKFPLNWRVLYFKSEG